MSKSKFSLGQAVQVLALKAVEDPDDSASYREVCRWYSKTFNTPLHTVENDLDTETVLQHFYETVIKGMKEQADSGDDKARVSYEKYKESILDPNSKDDETSEDDEWAQDLIREIKEQEAKQANKGGLNLSLNQVKLTDEDRKAIADDISKEFKRTIGGEEEPT